MITVGDFLLRVPAVVLGAWDQSKVFHFNTHIDPKPGNVCESICIRNLSDVVLLVHGPLGHELKQEGWYGVDQNFDTVSHKLIAPIMEMFSKRVYTYVTNYPELRISRPNYVGPVVTVVGSYPARVWFLNEADAVYNALLQERPLAELDIT